MAASMDDYYMVWGLDQTAYGPVDFAVLQSWIEEGRVGAETWIFSGKLGCWQRARKLSRTEGLFALSGDTTRLAAPPSTDPALLRGIRVLQGLTDHQLRMFARLTELEKAPQGARIISQEQSDESLYFILQGQLAVCLSLLNHTVVLAMLQPGDFFGDIALLHRGERTADVVARSNCLLAKLTASALAEMAQCDATASTRFLRDLTEALSARIRADNQRFAELLGSAAASA